MNTSTIQEPKNNVGRHYLKGKPVIQLSLKAKADTQAVCDELVEVIREIGPEGFDESSGLYLGTSDAGIGTSVTFWKEALEHGPGLVGPRLFPYTLANGPASCLARQLNIKGPSVTLVGEEEILPTLHEIAKDDMSYKRINKALVIYLNLGQGEVWMLIEN